MKNKLHNIGTPIVSWLNIIKYIFWQIYAWIYVETRPNKYFIYENDLPRPTLVTLPPRIQVSSFVRNQEES